MVVGWYVIDPPNPGVVTGTLKPVQADFGGELPVAGSLALALKKATASFIGQSAPAGPVAVSLKAILCYFQGTSLISGTMSLATKPVTASFTGAQRLSATQASVLAKVQASFAGTSQNRVDFNPTLAKLQAAFAANQLQAGTFDATLPKVRSQFAQDIMIGSVASTLKPATAQFDGVQIAAGTMDPALKKVLASLAGSQLHAGGVASTLSKVQTAFAGQEIKNATLAAALNKAQAAFAGEQAMAGTSNPVLAKPFASFGGLVVASQVSVNAIGTVGFSATGGLTVTTTFTIDVQAGSNKRLVVVSGGGQANWVDSYGTRTAVSSIDGALTEVQHVASGNSSGYRQAFLNLFRGTTEASVGLHTITVTQTFWRAINYIYGSGWCLNGVGGVGTPVTQAYTAGAALTPSVTVAGSNSGDRIVCVMGMDAVPGAFSGPWSASRDIATGSAQNGQGDYLYGATAAGDGTSKTFGATNPAAASHSMIAVNFTKAT